MECERIGRIVGAATDGYTEFVKDAVGGEVGGCRQKFVGLIPNLWSGGFVEKFSNPKVSSQFEVGPVVEGIAQAVGDRAGEGEKFFVRLCIARAEVFGFTVGAHGAPFIVIPCEPDVEEVGKTLIGGDVRRRQVRMVVVDRHFCRMFMIKLAG